MESKETFDEEKNEFVLYEDKANDDEERIENSASDIEMISDEEYLLECARFGEFVDLNNLFDEVKNLNVNYLDFKKNTALRINLLNFYFRYGRC